MVRQSQAGQRVAAQLVVHGRVQGVGYRYFVQEAAERLGLLGWVRNLPDGSVEAYAEGAKPLVEDWIGQLEKGPPLARVERVDLDWQTPRSGEAGFRVL